MTNEGMMEPTYHPLTIDGVEELLAAMREIRRTESDSDYQYEMSSAVFEIQGVLVETRWVKGEPRIGIVSGGAW